MLRQLSVRAALFAVLGVLLVACPQEDVSLNGFDQSLTVGDGSTSFTGLASGPSTISASTITSSVNYQPGTQEELRARVGDRIFFDTDSSVVNGRAQAVLNDLVNWLNSNPGKRIRIEGHADERGTREYNLALGDRRASAVVNYLTARGISQSRLTTISFGKERPVAGGSNATAWTQNRRAVFRVQ